MRKPVLMLLALALVVLGPSCVKDKIEQKVEDIVVQVMIDGVWVVSKYMEGTNDQTALFNGWESQFYENRTCVGRHTSGTVVNGTWDGSYASQSMTANFGNTSPVNKMNGTWKVVKSNYTSGQFTRTENGVEYRLEIMKK